MAELGRAGVKLVVQMNLIYIMLQLMTLGRAIPPVGAASPQGFISVNCGGAAGRDPVTTLNWQSDDDYLQVYGFSIMGYTNSYRSSKNAYGVYYCLGDMVPSVDQVPDYPEYRIRKVMTDGALIMVKIRFAFTSQFATKNGLDEEERLRTARVFGLFPNSNTKGYKACYELPIHNQPNKNSASVPSYIVRATFPATNWLHREDRNCMSEPGNFGDAVNTFYFSVEGVAVLVVELDFVHPKTIELVISPKPSKNLRICLAPVRFKCPVVAISSLELRPLPHNMEYVTPEYFLLTQSRLNLGGISNTSIRYPSDGYDRTWISPQSLPIKFRIYNCYFYDYPRNGSTSLSRFMRVDLTDGWKHSHIVSPNPFQASLQTYGDLSNLRFLISGNDSTGSVDPPLINAFELFWRVRAFEYTLASDVAALKTIAEIVDEANMRELGTLGDPCIPTPLYWIDCSNDRTSPARITKIRLVVDDDIGSYDRELVFVELRKLDRLVHLELYGDFFDGTFPEFFANISLTSLTLSDNRLYYPPTFSFKNLNGNSLKLLNLRRSFIYGELPVELRKFSHLQVLDLSHNGFTGKLFDITAFRALKILNLKSNSLHGTVPDSLWTGTNLEVVDLENNEFTAVNLTTWFTSVNQTKRVNQFPVRVNLAYNEITKVFPSSIENLELENTDDAYLSLAGNPWCNERSPLEDKTVFHFLCFSESYAEIPYDSSYDPPQPPSINTTALTTVVVTCASVVILFICVSACFMRKIRKRNSELHQIQEALAREKVKPPIFSYVDVVTATMAFSRACILGKGGFGTVYKAQFADGAVLAVKRLNVTEQSTADFLKEIVNISGIKHRHLIQLKGCCFKNKQHRLLIYEYAENRSLAEALWDPEETYSLTWYQRLNICLGVARGLAYLHEELQPLMVHRDIKPQNILLDKEYNAKIADFGLIRPSQTKDTQVTSHIGGTRGYSPPEYLMEGFVSEKLDVYSFGVVLLETISGRPCIEVTSTGERVYIPTLALSLLEKGQLLDLVDEKLAGSFEKEEAELVLRMGLACCHMDPKQRPAMSQVVSSFLRHALQPLRIEKNSERRERLQLYPLMEDAEESEEQVSDELALISCRTTSSSDRQGQTGKGI